MDSKIIALLMLGIFFLVTPTPQIVSVTPDYSINNQAVTVTITGKKFTKSSSVKLVKPGSDRDHCLPGKYDLKD